MVDQHPDAAARCGAELGQRLEIDDDRLMPRGTREFDEVRRRDGSIETLEACDQTVLEAGEAVILTTPTAGGAGKP